jgi:microcystin-dependent protein
MAKNKISEFSSTPANNTDIGGINIAEGCAPSGINNAIRELMAQLKDQQSGTDSDNFTVGGNLSVTGTTTLTGTTAAPTVSASDDSTKIATTAFVRDIVPTGVIVMWSGSVASIPSGWLLCDGSNSTPDLRNRFIIGAGSTYSVAGTGGSADAIVVSHTHTITDPGHAHGSVPVITRDVFDAGPFNYNATFFSAYTNTATATTGISIGSAGSSGTNANLPPYYALAYIMKS